MAKEEGKNGGLSNALIGMIVMGIAGAIVVGLAFQVIVYWPIPVSITPYFADSLFPTGACWGLIVGATVGYIVGWITDEKHYPDSGTY
jgi:uncharacterized membrane protein YeaQ/YmgE (transglycosylase-associated protein family)